MNHPEERKFGRQLSTNIDEIYAATAKLSLGPEAKNVKAPTSSRGLAVNREANYNDRALSSIDITGDSQHPLQSTQQAMAHPSAHLSRETTTEIQR